VVSGEAFHRRVATLAARLSERDRQALLLFDPASVRYVTGVALPPSPVPAAACVWASGSAAVLVPESDRELAEQGWIGDVRCYDQALGEGEAYRWIAREAGGPLLVDRLPAAAWLVVTAVVEEVALQDLAAELRRVKSPEEVALIERAAEYADIALERTFARLSSGSSELEILAEVVQSVTALMRDELGEHYELVEPPLTGVVQSGTRAAIPSAPASRRRLGRGDVVIAEFTACVAGYHAQAGCTFFVGDPLRDVVRGVETAVQAQAAALEAATSGATAAMVDQAARRVIERVDRVRAVTGGTGYGIGLARWEAPWLRPSDQTPLVEGMVLVLRSALSIDGRTGARHAQTVVIEAEGPRVLNPRQERWARLEDRLKEF
jgi:Xaa-Pro aminopeptidase